MRFGRRLAVAVVWAVVWCHSCLAQTAATAPPPGKTNYNDPDRQRGMQLYKEHKLPEAAALLEKVVARYPEDVVAHEALGSSLLSRAATWIDPAKRKADRLAARAELLRAKELGDNSDLCKTLLAGIPADGSEGAFSQNPEAEAAMQRGEAAFARGEWDDAIAGYKQALAVDPKLYYAAVDIGDSYFRMKKTDQAGEWFAKAIQIAPNEETAYRYWGDALLGDGRMQEARTKFIEGFLANPYRVASWGGMNNWINQNHLGYKEIPIKIPQTPADSSTLNKGNGGEAWGMYFTERTLWRNEKFAKGYPQEKTYRHSLKEETSALSMVASAFDEIQQKQKFENPDPSLVMLSRLKTEGMLEPFVLLMHPDAGVQRDYPAYRAANRQKLVEFLDKYVLPPTP